MGNFPTSSNSFCSLWMNCICPKWLCYKTSDWSKQEIWVAYNKRLKRFYFWIVQDCTKAIMQLHFILCERPSLINGRVSLRNSLFRPNARINKTTNTKTISLFIQKLKKKNKCTRNQLTHMTAVINAEDTAYKRDHS